MKLEIDIPEKDYDKMRKGELVDTILVAIKNGTPLPKGHGRLADADKIINSLRGIERLHIDDGLRNNILDAINSNVF